MGFRTDGPSDAWLLAAPESNAPSGDMTTYIEVNFDEGHVYAAAIIGIRVTASDIETRRPQRITCLWRTGEPVVLSTELREALECEFAMACDEDKADRASERRYGRDTL